ncbi:MAG: glycosyltransferase family 4 protein [Gammaproteobacteria bacterium]
MKVLLVTDTFPTPDRPSAGIFVRHQFRFFRSHATDDESFSLFKVRTHTRGKRHSLPRRLWSLLKFIPHYFRHYDIVHVHSVSTLMHAARLYRFIHPRSRLILSIHGSSIRQFDQHRPLTRKRFAKSAQRFDQIVIAGETLRPVIEKELGVTKANVICAGADDLRFHSTEKITKEFDFIFVGSFSKHKGADILLAALNMLESQELKVCFVGNGELEDELKRAGHHIDIQVFVDVTQTRLRQLYGASKFIVFPARGESFGLVVTEAMYCGVPAIVYAESGASVQVMHQANGLVYKPNTPDQLSRTLSAAVRMDSDRYREMSDHATQSNLEYSLSRVGTQLMQLYRQTSAEQDLTKRS